MPIRTPMERYTQGTLGSVSGTLAISIERCPGWESNPHEEKSPEDFKFRSDEESITYGNFVEYRRRSITYDETMGSRRANRTCSNDIELAGGHKTGHRETGRPQLANRAPIPTSPTIRVSNALVTHHAHGFMPETEMDT